MYFLWIRVQISLDFQVPSGLRAPHKIHLQSLSQFETLDVKQKTNTSPKFKRSPSVKLPKPNRKGSSSNHPFFRGYVNSFRKGNQCHLSDGKEKNSRDSSRWWFQRFFIFIPTWGRFPLWLIFSKGLATTNKFLDGWQIFNPTDLGYAHKTHGIDPCSALEGFDGWNG